MSKMASIILSLLLALTLSAQDADSSRFAALEVKLDEYFDAMKHESLAVQASECDFLIESAADSVLRQFIAGHIYHHYIDSPLMGSENVAIHVFDRWFADGAVAMSSPDAYAQARTHADFNRQSLLGLRAPELTMETPDGSVLTLWGPESKEGKYTVLFFYDTDCPKCRLETLRLHELQISEDYPISLYAIYAGDSKDSWEDYAAGQPRFIHLWDPDLSSDFQRKYGVTRTPRIFLVSPDGVILGRGLDAEALKTMLDGIFAPKRMEYGSRESEELFDGIFAQYDGKPSVEAVKGIADYIHDRTLPSGDTLMFKQLSGDYLYYLSKRYGEGYKEGLNYHLAQNVFSQPKVWKSSDDSLKVVGFAKIMDDLLSKAMPGTRIPSIKVPGESYTWRGKKNVKRRLDRLGAKENIIIFYTEGCEVCAAEKDAALARLTSKGVKVFMVNVDSLMYSDPESASRLMDAFDLSSLPYIIMTGSDGMVLRRYLTLVG